MREIASLELHLALEELRDSVEGSYFRKFYEDGKDSFRFLFYKGGVSTTVYCRLVKTFNSTRYLLDAQPATQFAIAMRKRVENARVRRLYQYGTERIIVIVLEAAGREYSIAIEMFGRGNLILVKDGSIDLCYKRVIYKEREVRSKAPYKIAEGGPGIEELRGSIASIVESVCREDDSLIKALARRVNVGPLYLDDALRSHGIDPRAGAGSVDSDLVLSALGSLFDTMSRPAPTMYMKDGACLDYSAFPLRKYDGLEKKGFATMNELLDDFNKEARLGRDAESEKRIAEIEASIKKQRALLERFHKESGEYAEIGREVLENMDVINSLIYRIKQRKKPAVEELDGGSPIKVLGIDLKRKTVTIELQKQ